MIMKALGHPEELSRTAEHHPPHVDPRASPVRQQRTKQLRNSTAQSSRVDYPNRPSTQQFAGMLLGQAHALDHRLKQIAAEILEIPSLKRNRGKRSEILKKPSLKRNRDKITVRPAHTATILTTSESTVVERRAGAEAGEV
jgi:hypothetical protein